MQQTNKLTNLTSLPLFRALAKGGSKAVLLIWNLGYDRDIAYDFSLRFRVGTAMFKSALNAATYFQWRWSPNEHRAESAEPFIGTQNMRAFGNGIYISAVDSKTR